MKINNFEEILSWQKARILTSIIYKYFSNNRDYGFRDQITRASVSIMNNIAEGFDRRRPKEFKYYLMIAKGSTAEVRSMSYLALDNKYIEVGQFKEINQKTDEISRLLSGLIKSIS